MSRFTQIDLSTLATPAVIEAVDFATIKAQMIADLVARDSSFSALLESDPAVKVLEACAYREMLQRQRINDAARACMLATATGTNLDNLAALVATKRLSATDAAGNVTYESDERLRMRAQLAPEAFAAAGPRGAYLYHAFSVSLDIADVSAVMSMPGTVRVTVLATTAAGTDGYGTPSQALLDSVASRLNADDVRPLTDVVEVRAPEIVHYSIAAAITLYYGPDASVVKNAVAPALQAYARRTNRLGYNVELAGLYAALQQSGVENSVITSPAARIVTDDTQVAVCDGITVTVAGRDE
jgi:phage-related baseplate assembly protein